MAAAMRRYRCQGVPYARHSAIIETRTQGYYAICFWRFSRPWAYPGCLTSAFNLAVHAVNLGEHIFGPGLHLQVG